MDFVYCKISDISSVSAGGDRPDICSDYRSDETPVPIYSNGVENEGLYGYTDSAKIEGDSVTISARGVNIGTVCYRKEPFLPIVRLLSLVPDRTQVNARYLYYYLCGVHISGTGSAQPQITVPMVANLEIKIHKDIAYQEKIAKILSSFDEKISTNKQIVENMWSQIDAYFGKLYSDSSSEKLTFGDVVERCSNKVGESEVKVLSPVSTGEIVLSEEYFSKQVYSKDISKYLKVEPYEYCYNPARANIGSIGMNDFDFTGCVSPVYVVFKTTELMRYYISRYFKTEQFKAEVVTRSSGSVRQALKYDDLTQIEFIKPKDESLKEFNVFYETLKKQIGTIMDENAGLVELRDSILPQLMSGELDIADISI